MIVAFEGIDGAGKTTTAPLVAKNLSAGGLQVIEASKRRPGVENEFVAEQLAALADRLWGVPHDSRLDALGITHWIYLNAAYFAGTHFALSAQLGDRGIAVFDNWINKFVARAILQSGLDLEEVLPNLSYLPQPDLVFLLDTPPQLALERKATPSDLERGASVNRTGDFESYQAGVRSVLVTMAQQFGWVVVATAGKNADEIGTEVSDLVRQHWSSARTGGFVTSGMQ